MRLCLLASLLAAAVILTGQLQPSNAVDFAALAVSNTTQQDPVSHTWTNYCAVINSQFTKIKPSSPGDTFTPAVTNDNDPLGCSDLPPQAHNGSATIVYRGNCTFYRKAFVAQSANSSLLVVIYNESIVDSSPDLRGGEGETVAITIPVLMVDNVTGSEIMEQYNSSRVYLSTFIPSSVPIDPSFILIFVTAVFTVLMASFLSNSPFEFLRYGLLIRKGSEVTTTSTTAEKKLDRTTVIATIIGVVLVVAFAVTNLVLLYEFYYPMVYFEIALFTVAATVGLYNLLSPFVALIPLPEKCRLPKNKIPILKHRPDPLFFITLLFCIGIAVWWAVERHSSYAWLLQNILGFAFLLWLLKRLLFLRPWVIALLMVLLFFYDIFMVFITPYFTSDGVSVMERAAVGPNGFSTSEQLPVVFKVPRLIYPTKLDTLCSNYFTGRPYSLLGYGDVGIPGLLVSQCFKFDFTVRKGKCCRLYYATSGIAYIVGFIATTIALTFMKTAQPALLYLVPTTLGSIIILSLIRREFVLFFTGKSESKAKSEDSSKEGGNSETETEAEQMSESSEKDKLINDSKL